VSQQLPLPPGQAVVVKEGREGNGRGDQDVDVDRGSEAGGGSRRPGWGSLRDPVRDVSDLQL